VVKRAESLTAYGPLAKLFVMRELEHTAVHAALNERVKHRTARRHRYFRAPAGGFGWHRSPRQMLAAMMRAARSLADKKAATRLVKRTRKRKCARWSTAAVDHRSPRPVRARL